MAESSDLPVYEVRNPDGSRELAIWADGRIEGGPFGLMINRIPALVAAERLALRDYFAGQAILGAVNGWSRDAGACAEAARRAYLMADAMLAERAK